MLNFTKITTLVLLITFSFTNCSGNKFGNTRETPVNAQERARKNVEEGRGAGLGGLLGNRGTNYEFSSSNSMWRASLELLDFLPLSTVDYSGGVIVSDWYSDNSKSNESIKISVRFLSNEIRSDSLKIIVHKKNVHHQIIARLFYKKTQKLLTNLEEVSSQRLRYLKKQKNLKK